MRFQMIVEGTGAGAKRAPQHVATAVVSAARRCKERVELVVWFWLIRPTRGFQSMKTAYATIKGFEIMRCNSAGSLVF